MRTKARVDVCPECGGIARVNSSGAWRCEAFDQVGMTKVSVCGARGVEVSGELAVTRGSIGLWRELLTEGV